MLLGDSITELSFAKGGFATRLAEAYVRKMDVINRGFSGYNTDLIMPVFEQCFTTQRDEPYAPKVRILVIWFGANDAALPSTPQHVPLARYKANLASIVQAVRSPASPRYSPETCVILMTPPPVQHERWAREWAAYKGVAAQAPDWDFESAKLYAEGVVEVGESEGVPVVDVWTKMWEAAGKDLDKVGEFLADGLHLNEKGYELAYLALTETIAKKKPEYHYSNMQPVFMEFTDLYADFANHRRLSQKRSAYTKQALSNPKAGL
ncbi:SGNH hydrolase [Cubamyces sp. BRFM 1775]|nr:SGNH hydrolase [Cubamyces sp. BRFM 1775]